MPNLETLKLFKLAARQGHVDLVIECMSSDPFRDEGRGVTRCSGDPPLDTTAPVSLTRPKSVDLSHVNTFIGFNLQDLLTFLSLDRVERICVNHFTVVENSHDNTFNIDNSCINSKSSHINTFELFKCVIDDISLKPLFEGFDGLENCH